MGSSGARMYMRINEDHNFKLWMSYGLGTNSRVELLTLWGLLQFTLLNGIVSIQILGDSKVIINWDKHMSKLQVFALEHWCQRVTLLILSFMVFSICQVYR